MPADDMYPQPLPGLLVELDARNRASLGKLARHRRYLAKLQPDGTIVLTPAAVVPLDTRTEAEKFRDAGIGPSWPSDPGYAEAEAARVQGGRSVSHWDDPSDNIGPTGRGVTAAPHGDDEPDEANYRDQTQDADDDRERMAQTFWQDYASERDA